MKQTLHLALCLMLAFIQNVNAQAPICNWLDGTSGSSANNLQLLYGNGGMKTDAQGNVYFVGPFSYGTFGAGSFTVTDTTSSTWFYYGKINTSGKVLWLKPIAVSGNAYARTIAVNSQGHFVISGDYVGTVSFDATHQLTNSGISKFFVAGFDSSGALLWEGTPGAGSNSYSQVYGLYLDDLNNTYCTGNFDGTLQYDTTLTTPYIAVFTAELSQNGSLQWIRTADASDIYAYSSGSNIVVSGNDLYIAGYLSDSITFPQNNTKLKSQGQQDIFLAKYTTGGRLEWAKYMGGSTGNDFVYGLAVDTQGRPCFSGTFSGSYAFFGADSLPGNFSNPAGYVVKCDSLGNILWSAYFYNVSTSHNAQCNDVASDSAGNIFVAGTFGGATGSIVTVGNKQINSFVGKGYSDGILFSFDNNGQFLWGKEFVSNSYVTTDQVSLKNKILTVAGSLHDTLSVDGFTVSANNTTQLFFAQMPEVTTTGVEQFPTNNENVSVYPNPSTGEINIVSFKNIVDLKVTNLLGQVIYESHPQQIHFNFELKDEGLYFIITTSDNETATNKIIISR